VASNIRQALLTGKLFAIDALVSLGANVNAADGELRTPLQVAIEHHQASAAAALRDLGAELLGQYANRAERSIAASRLATRLRELASMNDSRKLIAYLESGANPDHLEKVGPGGYWE